MTDLNRLDARREPLRDVDAGTSTPVSASPSPTAANPRDAHDLFDALVLRAPMPRNKDLAAFITASATSATSAASGAGSAERNKAAQARMDAFAASAGGPYKVDGQMVAARPHFVINNGDVRPGHAELMAIANAAHLGGVAGLVTYGRGAPDDVRKITQALLDAGKLEPGKPGAAMSDRIRATQWKYGVGFDCAGYAQQAAIAASGKSRAALFGNVGPGGALSLAHFHRVQFTSARPGDLLVLGVPTFDDYGHKTAVYANNFISSNDAQRRITESGGSAAAFGAGGPVHEYELDSSWGSGGEDSPQGGYRRDTCLYNEATKMWAFRHSGSGAFQIDAQPYEHPLEGTFRPNADKS